MYFQLLENYSIWSCDNVCLRERDQFPFDRSERGELKWNVDRRKTRALNWISENKGVVVNHEVELWISWLPDPGGIINGC